VESIIRLLSPQRTRDTHDNASRLLVEILRVSRDNQFAPANERCDDPLLAKLEDPATIELLLSVVFADDGSQRARCESAIVNGIFVLMALLDSRRQQTAAAASMVAAVNSYSAATFNAVTTAAGGESAMSDGACCPEEMARQRQALSTMVKTIAPRVADFTALLTHPPEKESVKTSAGVLEPPLGLTRLSKISPIMAQPLSIFSCRRSQAGGLVAGHERQ